MDLGIYISLASGTSVVPVQGTPAFNLAVSLDGRTFTITATDVTGDPTPDLALATLTLNGADVMGDAVGTGPWTYTAPDGAEAQTVAGSVSATNSVATTTQTFSQSVPANLFAPVALTAPFFTGDLIEGETVTINEGTYSGTPAPTVSGVLTLDGVDVSGDMAGANYTLPQGSAPGPLVWTETATNGIGADAEQFVSSAVQEGDTTPPVITEFTIDSETDPIAVSFEVSEPATVYGIFTVDLAQPELEADDVIAGKLQDGTTDAPLAITPIEVVDTDPVTPSVDISSLDAGTVRLFLVAVDAAGNKSAIVSASFERTLPAGAETFTLVSGGPYFVDPVNATPAGTTRVVNTAKLNMVNPTGGGAIVFLFSQQSTGCDLRAVNNGAGTLTTWSVTVKSGDNVIVLPSTNTNIETPAGVMTEVELDVDMAFDTELGKAIVLHDGVEVWSTTFAVAAGQQTFLTGRGVSFLAATNGTGIMPAGTEVERLAITRNGTLHKEILGPAATANADAWKLGSNAV